MIANFTGPRTRNTGPRRCVDSGVIKNVLLWAVGCLERVRRAKYEEVALYVGPKSAA